MEVALAAGTTMTFSRLIPASLSLSLEFSQPLDRWETDSVIAKQ